MAERPFSYDPKRAQSSNSEYLFTRILDGKAFHHAIEFTRFDGLYDSMIG